MQRTMSLLCFLALAACDKPAEKKETPAPPTATVSTAAAPSVKPSASPSASAEANGTLELHMTAQAATMAFDPTTLTVPAGSTVHLVLENQKPGALPHNWALVNAGTEAKVAAEGLKKGEEGNYMADSPDILAHTNLVKPGTTGEVTFKAPAAGKYPYICTYPGHYVMMKGVLTVTP